MKEIWIDIPEYEGMYKVSNLGRVKSMERIAESFARSQQRIKERILIPYLNCGYPTVYLCKNSIKKGFAIHVLIAHAFIPNPGNKPEINHIDSNRANNNLDNLEWVTHAENLEHARKKGRMNYLPPLIGEENPNAVFSNDEVRHIRAIAKKGEYSKIAREYGVTPSLIGQIVRRKAWKHI